MARKKSQTSDDAEDALRRDALWEARNKSWPSIAAAAQTVGVSTRTLRDWAESGELRTVEVDGVLRFDPSDLHLMKPDERVMRRDFVVTMTQQATQLLKLSTEPADKLFKTFERTLERQAARIDQLEQRHIALLELQERMASERDEREVNREIARREQDRIDHGVETLERWLPKLASQALGRRKVQKVIESMSLEQIFMLKEIGAITDEQVDLLRQIQADVAEEKKREQQADAKRAPPTEAPKEATGDGPDSAGAESPAAAAAMGTTNAEGTQDDDGRVSEGAGRGGSNGSPDGGPGRSAEANRSSSGQGSS